MDKSCFETTPEAIPIIAINQIDLSQTTEPHTAKLNRNHIV